MLIINIQRFSIDHERSDIKITLIFYLLRFSRTMLLIVDFVSNTRRFSFDKPTVDAWLIAWLMNKTSIFILEEMKYRWTGVLELTVPLAYLNWQLSFETRASANDTPTQDSSSLSSFSFSLSTKSKVSMLYRFYILDGSISLVYDWSGRYVRRWP